MEPDTAKQLLAAYFAGGPVARTDLKRAWQAAQADPDYVAYLLEELGLEPQVHCDAFVARAAEYAEMNPEQRRQEAPELSAHVESCSACKALLLELNPWSQPASPLAARSLAEPIRLTLLRTGDLVPTGLVLPGRIPQELSRAAGLPPAQPEHAALGERAALGGTFREWVLEDPCSRCALRLVARSPTQGEVAFRFYLEFSLPTSGAQQAWLEVREATSNLPRAADFLEQFQDQPLLLSPGAWSVRIAVNTPEGTLSWEIPLIVQMEGDNEPISSP